MVYLGRSFLFSFLFVLSISWCQAFARETVQLSERHYLDRISSEKAHFDGRQFRSFILPNQLEVLLIHDPSATKSAAALDVGIGFYQDPPEFPGMAHYLEHMLFLGTKKYPNVEEYSEYLSKNGGSNNAYTTEEHTNYHFEVNSSVFPQALDRFAQFFIAPEFNPKYLDKELKNIDSEYSMRLDDFSFHQWHLLNVLGNPKHPAFRVFQGNLATLSGITRETMLEHYQKYYSANLMKLAIISSLPLEQLESLVRTSFEVVPNRNIIIPKIYDPVTSRGSLPRLILMGTNSSNFNLTLHFSLSSSREYLLSKPHEIICSLLNYEGEGSLAFDLKKRGWINQFVAHSSDQSFGSELDVNFDLTSQGAENTEKIIGLFFSYIQGLKEAGLESQVFSDFRKAEELKTVFDFPSTGMDAAVSYAGRMQVISPSEIETLGKLLVRYSPKTYSKVLNEISPDSVQAILAGSVRTDRKEPLYNIDYSVLKFGDELVSDWKKAQPLKGMRLPPANPYFPNHFATTGITQPFPTKIRNDERSELWLQVDHVYHQPKAVVDFDMILPAPKSNSEYALRSLFASVIQESMLDLLMQGYQAKINMNLAATETGFRFSFSGFSDKLVDFARDAIARISRLDMSGLKFERQKIELAQIIAGRELDCRYCLSSLLNPSVKTGDEMIPSILEANVRKLDSFLWQMFSKVYIRGFGFGDIDAESIQTLADQFLTTFRSEGLPPSEFPVSENVKLPTGKEYVKKIDMSGADNVWISYHQFGATTPEREMSLQLGSKFLETAFFTEMRTARTLGYVVGSYPSINSLSCGMTFLIESNQSLSKVRRIAEDWIQTKVQEFPLISQSEFESLRGAALEELDQPARTFADKFTLFDIAIMSKNGDFDWKRKKIEALKTISLETVSQIWAEAFSADRKRKITVAGFGESAPHTWKKHRGEIEVKDTKAFKTEMKKFIKK